METLTATEQLSLDILDAKNADQVHVLALRITDLFKSGEVTRGKAKDFRAALTEKLKDFGYKKCGGSGR